MGKGRWEGRREENGVRKIPFRLLLPIEFMQICNLCRYVINADI